MKGWIVLGSIFLGFRGGCGRVCLSGQLFLSSWGCLLFFVGRLAVTEKAAPAVKKLKTVPVGTDTRRQPRISGRELPVLGGLFYESTHPMGLGLDSMRLISLLRGLLAAETESFARRNSPAVE